MSQTENPLESVLIDDQQEVIIQGVRFRISDKSAWSLTLRPVRDPLQPKCPLRFTSFRRKETDWKPPLQERRIEDGNKILDSLKVGMSKHPYELETKTEKEKDVMKGQGDEILCVTIKINLSKESANGSKQK